MLARTQLAIDLEGSIEMLHGLVEARVGHVRDASSQWKLATSGVPHHAFVAGQRLGVSIALAQSFSCW
jgi:hypothetical protein